MDQNPIAPLDATYVITCGAFADECPTFPPRHWLAPPGVPADRIAALREAFAKALNEPELLTEAKARQLAIRPVSWQKLAATVDQIMKTDDATVSRLKGILGAK